MLRNCLKAFAPTHVWPWSFAPTGKLSEDSNDEHSLTSGVAPRQFKNKLEEALTAKQEFEAKNATLENKVKTYEVEIQELKGKVGIQ